MVVIIGVSVVATHGDQRLTQENFECSVKGLTAIISKNHPNQGLQEDAIRRSIILLTVNEKEEIDIPASFRTILNKTRATDLELYVDVHGTRGGDNTGAIFFRPLSSGEDARDIDPTYLIDGIWHYLEVEKTPIKTVNCHLIACFAGMPLTERVVYREREYKENVQIQVLDALNDPGKKLSTVTTIAHKPLVTEPLCSFGDIRFTEGTGQIKREKNRVVRKLHLILGALLKERFENMQYCAGQLEIVPLCRPGEFKDGEIQGFNDTLRQNIDFLLQEFPEISEQFPTLNAPEIDFASAEFRGTLQNLSLFINTTLVEQLKQQVMTTFRGISPETSIVAYRDKGEIVLLDYHECLQQTYVQHLSNAYRTQIASIRDTYSTTTTSNALATPNALVENITTRLDRAVGTAGPGQTIPMLRTELERFRQEQGSTANRFAQRVTFWKSSAPSPMQANQILENFSTAIDNLKNIEQSLAPVAGIRGAENTRTLTPK